MANRLATATSPYLLQHKDNPVDWFPWGETAFAEARRRDVPVLLSVGYAACHWCHVMAHDSFERADVAAVMNAHFVNVKVDREERPDVDAVYMQATQAMTGQGGWPMTCLLTPDGRPFFAGTFFPREQFVRLLQAAAAAWRDDHERVLAAGQQIVGALAARSAADRDSDTDAAPPPAAADLAAAADRLLAQADRAHGGFGGAPKFPPSMVIEFLLRQHERTGAGEPLAVAAQALEAMARGGVYDQLAGGFHRYSVDDSWVVPHFEKMLYDNALLLPAYLHWWRLTGSELARRVAGELADFLLRDLRTAQGGFAASLDADAGGVEGRSYVWTPAQLREALGPGAADAARWFGVTAAGPVEGGGSTLRRPADPPAAEAAAFAAARGGLLAARQLRPQPARDDKVVTGWNGLVIGALAEAGVLLGEPRYVAAATACARLLLSLHVIDGRLRRVSRDGAVGSALAIAEDYGDLAAGLLMLHQATGGLRWLAEAGELLDTARRLFAAGDGGYYDTGADAEALVVRPADPTDNATPSGTSALAGALLGYAALTGSLEHRAAAERALGSAGRLAVAQPRFFGWALATAEALVGGPVEVAVVGERAGAALDPPAGALTRAAWRHRPPGAVVVSGRPDAPGQPLLADRPLLAGGPAAYVCRGMVCDRPVRTAAELVAALGQAGSPVAATV